MILLGDFPECLSRRRSSWERRGGSGRRGANKKRAKLRCQLGSFRDIDSGINQSRSRY
jgi:hypothetical protein